MSLPQNLISLHRQEDQLREKALPIVVGDRRLQLHISVTERAMNLCELFRQHETEDEDLRVIQILGMRVFNAFGASLKLALSGYLQNSALIMRDILETVFLLDLLSDDRAMIKAWRNADKKERMKKFSPVAVRTALDVRYGNKKKRRDEHYKLFCELAGHPNMKSDWMMRPEKNGNAVIGPFIEKSSLEAVISEMGQLAVQVGIHLVKFYPDDWSEALEPRGAFAEVTQQWFAEFFPDQTNK